jgi:integrase
VIAKAGLRYRYPESLRHSFALNLLSANAPILYAQRAGGWATASVLLRVYARWLPSFETSVEAATLDTPTHAPATPAQLRARRNRGSA